MSCSITTSRLPRVNAGSKAPNCVDAHGAAVPLQFSNVSLYRDGSVAGAALWFLTTLPANGTQNFTLKEGTKKGKHRNITTDLELTSDQQTVTFANAQLGVRLLLGEAQFARPVAAAQIPAPLQMVRLRSGIWVGTAGSRRSICVPATARPSPMTARCLNRR